MLAGGVTAGCGGRSDAGQDATTTAPPPTTTRTTPTGTTTRASTTGGDGAAAAVDDSFEQGPGTCALEADPIPEGTWPMTHHDPGGTNASQVANGPTGFPINERWTMSAVDARITFPVADENFVYLVAADPDSGRNGEIQWRYKIDAMPIGPPVAAAGLVYVPFGTRGDARVLAIDRTNGELRNAYDLPDRFVGELGTAGTSLVMPSEDAYRVVDARTGEHCWSFTPN